MASTLIEAGLLVGVILALAWAGRREISRRAERRNLASALTGEMVAVLQAIESENSDSAIGPSDDPNGTRVPHLILPHFTVFEANAAKLDQFAAPLPRKIVLFFGRLGALAQECGAETATSPSTGTDRAHHLQRMRDDLKSTLEMGDEILLALRTLTAPHSQVRHLS